MDAIWIHLDGRRYGPYPPAQVSAMLADGLVPEDAEVWWPPAQRWVGVHELHVIAEQPAAQPVPVAVGCAGQVEVESALPASAVPVTEPSVTPATGGLGRPPAHHRPRIHLAAPEQPRYVGGSRPGEALAFTAMACGVAGLAISWVALLRWVSVLFALTGAVVAIAVLLGVGREVGGKRMAWVGLVLSVAAMVVGFVVAPSVGAPADPNAPSGQAPIASPVKVSLGDAAPARATTVLPAHLFNSGDEPVDGGMFTVEARLEGSVIAQTTETVPALQPGASAPVRVVFLEELPAGARYAVTKVTTLPL